MPPMEWIVAQNVSIIGGRDDRTKQKQNLALQAGFIKEETASLKRN